MESIYADLRLYVNFFQPVQPTAHYAMGGIPTDIQGRVIIDKEGTVLPGLYAVGEAACVSVHGANRLGTNSLVDLVVFGRRAGIGMAEFTKDADLMPMPANAAADVIEEINRIRGNATESNHTSSGKSCSRQ
jgi:succinate dehydrogenase / fumarate reductase flavoprotein subunit